MYSIYHFFAHLMRNKQQFRQAEKLNEFPFDMELLSCRSDGKFPDMAIRINPDQIDFTGGELIELKDSQGYSVASFNSTIPTGKKDVRKVARPNSSIYRQMVSAGDNVDSLLERDAFYLVRGRRQGHVKVCLVHGSFFETVKVDDLIRRAFSQVLDERVGHGKLEIEESLRALLVDVFSDQESFSKVRDVENASVKLRFRIMTEAKSEGNILNPQRYSEILDDTLNFVVPCDSAAVEDRENRRVRLASSAGEYEALRIFKIKHWLNGEFLVFQTEIGS